MAVDGRGHSAVWRFAIWHLLAENGANLVRSGVSPRPDWDCYGTKSVRLQLFLAAQVCRFFSLKPSKQAEYYPDVQTIRTLLSLLAQLFFFASTYNNRVRAVGVHSAFY